MIKTGDCKFKLLKLQRANLSDCQEFFGTNSYFYSPWNWASKLISTYIPENGYVLDLASGYGNPYIMEAVQRLNTRIELVDILPTPEEHLPKLSRYSRLDLSVETPSFEEQFDCIISISSLEHIPKNSMLMQLNYIKSALKIGGVAALSIGHFLGIKNLRKTQELFLTSPFFIKKGYSSYPPLDMKEIFETLDIPLSQLPAEASFFPGMGSYNDTEWIDNKEVIKEAFADYPELANIPHINCLYSTEILIVFQKLW